MSAFLIGVLIGIPIAGLILFARFGGSFRRRKDLPASVPAKKPEPATAPVADKSSWSWIMVPLTIGLVIFLACFCKEKPGEIHSMKVVMNSPGGVRIEGLQPGRYWFWAEDAPRKQLVFRRIVEVWPDGRTLDEIGGTTRPGYYTRLNFQEQNPIPREPSYAMIVWGREGKPKAFRGGVGAVEAEVANAAIVDLNVPRNASYFQHNGGESTIYYQRRS